jgi:hypothetical protein
VPARVSPTDLETGLAQIGKVFTGPIPRPMDDYQAKSPAIPHEAINMQTIQAAITSRILNRSASGWYHMGMDLLVA